MGFLGSASAQSEGLAGPAVTGHGVHVPGSRAGLGLTRSFMEDTHTHTHTHTPGHPLPVEGLLAQGDGCVGGPRCWGSCGLSEAGRGQHTAEAVGHL